MKMKTKPGITKKLADFSVLLVVIFGLGLASSSALADKTGTDPRDFASKFMPFSLHTELENGLEVNQINVFGLFAFDKDFAVTYDAPMSKEINFDDTDSPLDTVNGMGDFGLRFFYKPESTQFPETSHMFGAETLFPTATEKFLGGDATIFSPMYVYVKNVTITGPGFLALMNFMDFDIAKDDGVDKTRRYRGRWFAMIPLAKPGPNFLDGWYLLPELQPVYDFEADDDEFSLWFAPELGKVVASNFVMYAKPGWGIVKDAETDRDFTFEFGFRYFMGQ
jgi:hypothetical protein